MHDVIQLSATDREFNVVIPGDGVGGFEWLIDSYDSQILQFVKRTTIPNKTMLVGGGVQAVFRFKLLEKKDTEIKFISRRSWSDERGMDRVFEIKV